MSAQRCRCLGTRFAAVSPFFVRVIAFSAFCCALGHLDVAIVSLYSYVDPMIAIILGVLILRQPFGLPMLLVSSIIALAMVIVETT